MYIGYSEDKCRFEEKIEKNSQKIFIGNVADLQGKAYPRPLPEGKGDKKEKEDEGDYDD